jgi:hypothetical protein
MFKNYLLVAGLCKHTKYNSDLGLRFLKNDGPHLVEGKLAHCQFKNSEYKSKKYLLKRDTKKMLLGRGQLLKNSMFC